MSNGSGEDRAAICALLAVLREVSKEGGQALTVGQLRCYLEIALADQAGESLEMKELAQRAGMGPSSTTRALVSLMDLNRARRPGLGFVEQKIDLADRRHRPVSMTAKGRKFAADLLKTLRPEIEKIERRRG